MPNQETVREISLAYPEVEERACYGTQAFYVRRKIFARFLEDGDSVVVKMDMDRRAEWTRSDPQTFFVTDHYLKHPMIVIRLSTVHRGELRELIEGAWRHAAPKTLLKRFDTDNGA